MPLQLGANPAFRDPHIPGQPENVMRAPAAYRPTILLGLLVSACGGGTSPDDSFAPPCPGAAILRDAADLNRYRGTGRDLTDLVLQGRITGLGGSCTRDGSDTVATTVSVGIELTRGPAAPGRQAELSYFVAVLDGERILDKQVFTLRAEFPGNTDKLKLIGDEVELRLPTTPTKSAASYRIQVGFQLSPLELEVNRARPAR